MHQQQYNGFGTLDDFLDSLITEELSQNSYETGIVIDPSSPQANEIVTAAQPENSASSQPTKSKQNQLDSPGAMQTLTHSLEGHSTILPKNNFGMAPSVVYSPPLSPECVTHGPMKGEENQQVMVFPPHHVDQTHPMMHAAQQGVPQFIGDKSFEKSYIYDPKPLTRKTRRALVPDEQKNQKYWLKRMRNNVAARKSREDRRRKELEVLTTMKDLREENDKMKSYIDTVVKANEQLVAEMMRMKHQMQQYENTNTKLVT